MRRCFLCLGILATFGILGRPSFGGSEGTHRSEATSRSATVSGTSVPTFTLEQAILTALQRNPTLLNAEQEIKRTRGVIIQVRAQALPQINANANFQWTDPHLSASRILGTTTPTSGSTTGGAAAALMEGLPSQVRERLRRRPRQRRRQVSRMFRPAMFPTRSVLRERSSFLTAQLSIRSGAHSFNATAPTSRSATFWTHSSRR